MSRPDDLFSALKTPAAIRALIGTSEDLHLDCKAWSDQDGQRVLAKAVSGFTNADGGVIVFGLDARSSQKDDPDHIQREVLVLDARALKSRIENLIGDIVEPRPTGVQVEAVLDSAGPGGFVVVLVPPNDGLPCRSRKDWKFYQRISAGTFPMEYFQIADMFGMRQRPLLKLSFEHLGPVGLHGQPARQFVIGIENIGRGLGKFPSLRYRCPVLHPVANWATGLPRINPNSAWVTFGGGADHVIYPGTVLEVGRFYQNGRTLDNVLSFTPFELNVELGAEDVPMTKDSISVPGSPE